MPAGRNNNNLSTELTDYWHRIYDSYFKLVEEKEQRIRIAQCIYQ